MTTTVAIVLALTWIAVAFMAVVRVHVRVGGLTGNQATDAGMLALAWPVILLGAVLGHGAGWVARLVRRAD